jgi:hypothetical protein
MFQCMDSLPVPVLFEFAPGHVSLRVLLLSELAPGHIQFLSLSLLKLFHYLSMSFLNFFLDMFSECPCLY